MIFSNEEHIKISFFNKLSFVLIIVFGILYFGNFLLNFPKLNSFSGLIHFIFPTFMLFLFYRIIFLYLRRRKLIKELGICTLEINEECFKYANKKVEYNFNSQNRPTVMKRNFESFIFEINNNRITIYFGEFILKEEEIDQLKLDFDNLKNKLYSK